MTTSARIEIVDPDDDATLQAWHRVERASILPSRPHAVLASAAQRVALVRRPTAYHAKTLLVARDAGEVVGIAELGLSFQDNHHLAEVQVCVLPARRRRGLGRALYDEAAGLARDAGRTTVIGEACTTDTDTSATDFASALGLASVHVEDHLVLRLPLTSSGREAMREAGARPAPDLEIVTWSDRCPDGLLAGYTRLRTQMENDVPLGQVALDPVVFDEARVRAGEERLAESHTSVVAAVRRLADDELVGYSRVLLEHGSTLALQDDTLVMPTARGHRLGLALKLATLAIVERDHPERTALHTWTAPDNHAMHRTNLAFGYRPVEVLHEMQRNLT
jgi:GNAT superfamily N-acetyltransferase